MSWINKCRSIQNCFLQGYIRLDSFIQMPKTRKICFGSIIVCSFILIYILNLLHPLFGDDWMYSMMPNSSVRVSNFSDILYTQYEHYFTWGGRSVVHVIDQSLLLLGLQAADLLNSIAYVGLTLIIYLIANQSKQICPSLLFGVNLLIWFFQPAFGSTILWITGSANYLWGSLIIISFLLPYIKFAYDPKHTKNKYYHLIFFPLGIIAGWTNENMAVALIFMLFVLLLFFIFYQKQLPLWSVLGLLGVVIGAVLMIAAPGNYARMEMILSNTAEQKSVIALYTSRFLACISAYYYYALGATFIYSLFLILHRIYGKNRKTVLFISLLFFFGAMVATLAMSGAPIFPGRAAFGINIFLFIAIATLFADLDFSKSIIRDLTYATLSFALLFFVADYVRAFNTLKEVNQHAITRLSLIEQGKRKGQMNFILEDRINPDSPYLHYFELTPDSTDWHNRMYSKYYGIESIIVK